MIKANKKEVILKGKLTELVGDLKVIVEVLEQNMTQKGYEDAGTFILELVAFSLCSEEEQNEILEERRKRCTE